MNCTCLRNLPNVLLNCKMAGPGIHLSVRMQSGCQILTKIPFTLLDITFAELFLHLSDEDERVGERRVAKVTIMDLAAVETPKWIGRSIFRIKKSEQQQINLHWPNPKLLDVGP